MTENDKAEFGALMATAYSVYGKPITKPFADLFFAALKVHELAVVREGLNRHLQDPEAGQYAPKPADIIRQIQVSQHDERPEGDEAWSIASSASDERVTAVLNDEIQGALWVCRPLIDIGDKIAARKAFLDAYARLVRAARESGKPAKWYVSLGHERAGRAVAIESAVRLGRLPQAEAARMLEHVPAETISGDGAAIAGLHNKGKVVKPSEGMREKWQELKRAVQANNAKRDQEAARQLEEARVELADRADVNEENGKYGES
ncbi:MAG: hypothetical protein ACRCTL_10965 [Pseudomonas sp.]